MNGTMRYLRRVNLGNWEHKEFSAEISYSTDDEADYLSQKEVIDRAADLAVQIAEERLGLRPTKDDNAATVKAALSVADTMRVKNALHRAATAFNAPITKEEVEKASKPPTVEQVEEAYDNLYREPAHKPALHLVEPSLPDAKTPPEIAMKMLDRAINPPEIAPQSAVVDLPDDDGVVVTVVEPEPDAEPQESFDAAAPVEPEISYDEMLTLVNGWVSAGVPSVRQGRVVAFQKLMRKYATQLSAIPQDRRVGFVAEFTELQAATK